jgi:hypothetical protein
MLLRARIIRNNYCKIQLISLQTKSDRRDNPKHFMIKSLQKLGFWCHRFSGVKFEETFLWQLFSDFVNPGSRSGCRLTCRTLDCKENEACHDHQTAEDEAYDGEQRRQEFWNEKTRLDLVHHFR